MAENNSEKREGFFQRLINAVRNIFGGGENKTADTTAVSTSNTSDLSRVEMLEMLVELGKENVKLKADLEEKNRVIEKQNLFLHAARKSAPVLTMEEVVELDSFTSLNMVAAGAGEMDKQAAAAEHKAAEAQAKLEEIEAKIAEAEKKAQEAAAMVEDAERRAQAAEEKAVQAEQRLQASDDAAEDMTAEEEAEETEKINASAENSETAEIPAEETEADAKPQEAHEEIEDAEESEEEFSEETKTESDDAEEAEVEVDDAEEAETESDTDEEDDFESPAPGSFAAMIAARAAEAAIRGRTITRATAEETVKEEPAKEVRNAGTSVKPALEVPDKKESEKERLERITGRVPMREAARRAGLVR